MTQSPVRFYKKPKPFDRDAAAREYAERHPEFEQIEKEAMSAKDVASYVVHADNPEAFFTTRFAWVHARRMQGLPIINTALSVRAMGFEQIESDSGPIWLGVVVTPWSVQAILAPTPQTDWAYAPAGSGIDEELPGGDFSFVACEDPLLGQYRMCSLKSPVFDFSDQQTAEAFALACLQLMLGRHPIVQEPEVQNPNLTELARQRAEQKAQPTEQSNEAPQSMSRRAFFTAKR